MTMKQYVGLSNQGATCYMNSLLQSLFMTPEFRRGLYQWNLLTQDDDHLQDDDKVDNIPYQLQLLFGRLQGSSRKSITTTALTTSFGWTSADAFQQHDVQELLRVLFDALELSWKGTSNDKLLEHLYQGHLNDYVKCCTCMKEASRQDTFLDLSLVIRPFGKDLEMMKSVEEAMELFLQPEILKDDNQWDCPNCNVKRNAIKGLKFQTLPYMLALQLKRFDFDYNTCARIKLNDRVTFPKYLDMNKYMQEGGGSVARRMSMERSEMEDQSKEKKAKVEVANTHDDNNNEDSMESSVEVEQASGMEKVSLTSEDIGRIPLVRSRPIHTNCPTWGDDFDLDHLLATSGPYIYELFSVLIHSGSATGGHYYGKHIQSFHWLYFIIY